MTITPIYKRKFFKNTVIGYTIEAEPYCYITVTYPDHSTIDCWHMQVGLEGFVGLHFSEYAIDYNNDNSMI